MSSLLIASPLACLAGDCGGIVVRDGSSPRCCGCGQAPSATVDEVFDASRHVVLPGLVNTHHHFYQTLTRAHPAGHQQGTVRLAEGALSRLVAADAGAMRLRPGSR
jgi:cytosine/adenosine deaminase-related metal-dependent hydrolase